MQTNNNHTRLNNSVLTMDIGVPTASKYTAKCTYNILKHYFPHLVIIIIIIKCVLAHNKIKIVGCSFYRNYYQSFFPLLIIIFFISIQIVNMMIFSLLLLLPHTILKLWGWHNNQKKKPHTLAIALATRIFVLSCQEDYYKMNKKIMYGYVRN